ncbi:carbohydrate ABC transporter permease [uncultured Traorella sp.]|uniref:carbohydrate ABC transporter permease n=1 Tax=uncultured Traorella sp. TaxID=1929048 RepID=UPI0025F641AC|nr:carbohydrate ABC transporter permease [uncultured Traorella sp.]
MKNIFKHLTIGRVLTYFFLIIGALIMVFPFYWMITGAFKTSLEIQMFPPQWIPSSFSFDNFKEALEKAPFATYFINSVIAMVSSVTLCTITTILGAFAFSKLNFPGRHIIFGLLLGLMMVPFEMIVITNYRTIIDWGIYNTLLALIIPFTSSIFYMYILKGFFDSIPDSLYQAARVDGCSNWKYLWRVMVPIAKPSLVTIILLNAIASWNSFLWPMLAVVDRELRTLPFGLYAFVSEGGAKTELMMAASTIIVIPMIILFIFARKQIVNGVARGGIKG